MLSQLWRRLRQRRTESEAFAMGIQVGRQIEQMKKENS